MHRHGYQGRKFGRERDQRRALMKSLSESLIIHGTIETTLPKAKEMRPFVEKLITRAKKGDLASRRIIIANVMTVATAHKLVDDIAPKLADRSSGYLRIKRTKLRRGDSAQLARISFVDDLTNKISTKKPDSVVKTTKSGNKAVKKPQKITTDKKVKAEK